MAQKQYMYQINGLVIWFWGPLDETTTPGKASLKFGQGGTLFPCLQSGPKREGGEELAIIKIFSPT
jgi:hypothetical protein